MRRSPLLSVFTMCLASLVLAAVVAEDKLSVDTAKIMKKKLHLSHEVLSGVAQEDFQSISTNADELLKLAKFQWIKNETPEYRSQLKDFWLVIQELKTSADEKNSDGTTLAYIQMTLCCVKCHKYLRDRAH